MCPGRESGLPQKDVVYDIGEKKRRNLLSTPMGPTRWSLDSETRRLATPGFQHAETAPSPRPPRPSWPSERSPRRAMTWSPRNEAGRGPKGQTVNPVNQHQSPGNDGRSKWKEHGWNMVSANHPNSVVLEKDQCMAGHDATFYRNGSDNLVRTLWFYKKRLSLLIDHQP